MNEKRKEIIKKCENIDKVKQDLNNIEKFDKIYSNFNIKNIEQNYPKIINDSEFSSIILNEGFNSSNEKYFNKYNNLTFFNNVKNDFDLSKNNEKENSKINKNKLAKNYIDILNRKKIEIELNKNIENKKDDENINKKLKKDKKESLKQKQKNSNKDYKSKINNFKSNNNKKKEKEKQIRNPKDINNNYLILKNETSLSSEKINQSKYIFYRLYNHGFYLKNKSQMNILSNLIQIKKDSERKNISKKSQEILGLNNNKNVKYSKDNIFKPIKTNMESTYTKFQFQPSLNETTKKLVKNMEKSFTRITRPKSKNQIEHQKKSISKEKLQKTLDRINFLYTDGLEKIKKKKISNSKLKEDENNDSLSNEKFGKTFDDCLKSIKSSKSSRNIYNKQIQWKRKLLMKNELKKKIEESKNSKECTFKPDITTKSIKYLFQKTAKEKNKTKNSKNINQNSMNKSLNNKNKMLISQKRYFIINDEKKLSNNRIKNKNNFKEKYKNKKIEYSLYQRKTYHLEKFFS